MYKYKFTVIVPMYNVEAYLAEALDSVINQSIDFKENIEIILVNDGSPDNCEKICKSYIAEYPENIRYFYKENGGLSSARNYGINYIQGKYVNFLDSDDKWDEGAFEKAYNFFEAHEDEIDFVASRVRFFDATNNWHILDFKYRSGTRVVDLSDKKECSCVQVQVASGFIKAEAVKNRRFNEKVTFGEDGLFSNPIILEKMKYGIIDDCIYYYRNRSDKSSLTQTQSRNRDYYTVSPKLYYQGLIDESEERFGCVVPYIQNVLAYDIGWRVKSAVPEEIKNDRMFFVEYLDFLNSIVSYIEDEVFLKSPMHNNIASKIAFYKLKHSGHELADAAVFNTNRKTVCVGDVILYNLSKEDHSACVITDYEINNDKLIVNGLVLRWLISVCDKEGLSFALAADDVIFHPEREEFLAEKTNSLFGQIYRYYKFSQELDLVSSLQKNNSVSIKAGLLKEDKICSITVKNKSTETETPSGDGRMYYVEHIPEGIIVGVRD